MNRSDTFRDIWPQHVIVPLGGAKYTLKDSATASVHIILFEISNLFLNIPIHVHRI